MSRAPSLGRKVAITATKWVCGIAFVLLVLTSLSNIVRGLTTVKIEHEGGVPQQWASFVGARVGGEAPETVTLPVTYWAQRADWPQGTGAASHVNRQFEWVAFGNFQFGLQQGLVRNRLGADGKPVPTANSRAEAVAAGWSVVNQGVWGDNFRRWFNEVPERSLQIETETITFHRLADGRLQYGGPNRTGRDVFPLNNVAAARAFAGNNPSVRGNQYLFTMQFVSDFVVRADGSELFEFAGDDDVWVFINDRLIVDIGGVHGVINGSFQIREPDAQGRIGVVVTVDGRRHTIVDSGLSRGEVATLSFFYAERSTSEANALITMTDFDWPILARPTLASRYDSDDHLIQYTTTLQNRDNNAPLTVRGLASWINRGDRFDADGTEGGGFLPLEAQNVHYTTTPDDLGSWQSLDISSPDEDGFMFEQEVLLASYGENGDTLFIRYDLEPESDKGELFGRATYLAESRGIKMAVSASTTTEWERSVATETDSSDDDEEIEWPNILLPEEWEPDAPLNLGEGERVDDNYRGPGFLVPNTGLAADFADVVLSQWFILMLLATFATSFCAWRVLSVAR